MKLSPGEYPSGRTRDTVTGVRQPEQQIASLTYKELKLDDKMFVQIDRYGKVFKVRKWKMGSVYVGDNMPA